MITLPDELGESLRQTYFNAGDILYAPNEKILAVLMDMRAHGRQLWSQKPITRPFPKALHGPDNQSLSVRNQEELDTALKNGWSLRPIVEDERPVDMPPSPDVAPRPKQRKPKGVAA